MFNKKWFDLLEMMQQKTHAFASQDELKERLESKFTFLKSQFSNIASKNDPRQQDWLEHESVTSVLSEVLKKQDFSTEEVISLFNLLMSTQLFQLALVVVNNSLDRLPEDDIELKRGIICFQMGDVDQAMECLNKARQINPENHQVVFHMGYTSLMTGEMDQAEAYFKQCADMAPEFVGSHQNLAGCYYQKSEFELAVASCEKVYELNQSIPSCYITAISSCIAQSKLEDAQTWLQRAEQHGIQSLELHRLKGLVACEQEDFQTAVNELNAYLEASEDNFDVLSFRARALAGLKDWEPLVEDLTTLLELDPHDTWCLENLFLAFYHLQKWDEAEEVMAELCRMSDHYQHTYKEQLEDIRKQHAVPVTIISE